MSEKIVLIDGHSILNRAFFGLPDLTTASGQHTNAVYGFLNILFKVLQEEKPDYLTVVFDVHGPTFRHKMYDGYKANRKPALPQFREQVPLMKEVLDAMGICRVEMPGYEGDDLMGTLSRMGEEKGLTVTILSGDRDQLQLASDRIQVRIPKSKGGKTVTEDYFAADVLEKYQVTPEQFVDLKALMGDSSDNIPGLPGVGEKTATRLILSFGSIENAYAHVEEITPNKAKEAMREHYDLAQLSKKLAAIDRQVPLTFSFEQARMHDFFTPEAKELFRQLEFKNLLQRMGDADPDRTVDLVWKQVETAGEMRAILSDIKDAPWVGIHEVKAGRVHGVAVSCGGSSTYFRIGDALPENELYEALTELISRMPQVVSFDVKALMKELPAARRDHLLDMGIAAYLLNPLKADYPYEDIARQFLGQELPSAQELLGKKKLEKAIGEDDPQLAAVGCYYAWTAAEAMAKVREDLKKTGMEQLYQTIEMPLLFTLFDMETEGVRVNAQELAAYGEKLQVRISELEQIIYEKAGEQFNINSPKQLGIILFEKLQLPGGKKTKTGYSTAADVLERLASDHDIVTDILEYRQLTKLKSTYADGLALCIGEDGRIHSRFNQTITATGRISSTEPNLQNIPIRMELGRLIRKVFIPRDGFVFLDADYSQIELRVLAHMSQDEHLIAAYRTEEDIHRITASQVFHTPFEEVTDLQRRNAKAVNFGIIYGISSFGLSQGLSISPKEAARYIEQYFETYPQIKGFLDGLVASAREKGYTETMFHRRRPIPELSSSNFMTRSFGERVAMNSPIQGTAADIIKIAMVRVDRRLKEEKLRSRLLLQVHDELLVETAAEELEQVSRLLEEEMRGAAELAVPLEVDMNSGASWYEAH